MREIVLQSLTANGHTPHIDNDIAVYTVSSSQEAITVAKIILYGIVNKKTALYLSGGSTPKELYTVLAQEEKIAPGVVGLMDERYGFPMHETSNEKMIAETGLLRYFSILDIPYYAMLRAISIEETAKRYDELIRSLETVFPNSIGILGVGEDGHTAGIVPHRSDFHNPLFDKQRQYDMVSWFDDTNGKYKQRVTQTFLALSHLDMNILLVLGNSKKKALEQMFTQGNEEDIPSRFFLRKDIALKTLLITDQKL